MIIRAASIITTDDIIDPRTGVTLIVQGTELTNALLSWLKEHKGIENVAVEMRGI